jgi:hypothetical protein
LSAEIVLPYASFSWSVSALVVEPSAGIVDGDAVMNELPAFAAAGATVTFAVDVSEPLTVSVAVSVCAPAVFSTTPVKVPVPFVSVESAGSVCWPSLVVKWSVPA